MAELNREIIGLHAGKVWSLLSDGQKWRYHELKENLLLRDRELNMALGWLVRENKITFEYEQDEMMVWIKDNFVASTFFF